MPGHWSSSSTEDSLEQTHCPFRLPGPRLQLRQGCGSAYHLDNVATEFSGLLVHVCEYMHPRILIHMSDAETIGEVLVLKGLPSWGFLFLPVAVLV